MSDQQNTSTAARRRALQNFKLVDAAPSSKWYKALERRDCRKLMRLMKGDQFHLVGHTAPKGRTVLHVAVVQGCWDLMEQALTVFGKVNSQNFPERYSVLLNAKDERWGGKTAYELARNFVGNKQIAKYLQYGPTSAEIATPPAEVTMHTDDECSLIVVREIIESAIKEGEGRFAGLQASFAGDVDYNFESEEYREFLFHHACSKLGVPKPSDGLDMDIFVKEVIHRCLARERLQKNMKLLIPLFKRQNWQGRPPLHALLASGQNGFDVAMKGTLVDLLWSLKGDSYRECVNARDALGRTIIHITASMKLPPGEQYIFNLFTIHMDKDVDKDMDKESVNFRVNSREENGGATALHLAILHNHAQWVKKLLDNKSTNVNAMLFRPLQFGDDGTERQSGNWWSPLQLAALMGQTSVVELLLKQIDNIYDAGKFESGKIIKPSKYNDIPALHFAAASGNPETLKVFLYNKSFNPTKATNLGTSLHFAASMAASYDRSHFIRLQDLQTINDVECSFRTPEEVHAHDIKDSIYKKQSPERKACILMLLQAGVDIWEKDSNKTFAALGSNASFEDHMWWHEIISKETTEAKKSLNDAGNAIAVIGALISTTSFAGPLQPPLGFDPTMDVVQVYKPLVGIFMVSNSLSFYFSIAAILFAVVPSLRMPQESMYHEWKQARRNVCIALGFLLVSVVCSLVSFAAAANAGMPHHYSWQHFGLAFYPIILGILTCLSGVFSYFVRLLRLVFCKDERIKWLYQRCIGSW